MTFNGFAGDVSGPDLFILLEEGKCTPFTLLYFFIFF